MAARPRCFWLVVIAGTAVLAGCGESPGPDYSLKTPPPRVGGEPVETPASERPRGSEPWPTQRQAERLRSVLVGWAAAVRRGDPDRAARYFAVPAIVAQSMPVELQTREQVRKFNDELPCGARLLEVQHDGRYIVGTFRLTERAGRTRAEAEERVRALIEELARLDGDTASVAAQQAEWLEARAERRVALQELESASAAAEASLSNADATLAAAEQDLDAARAELEAAGDESHALQVRLTEATGLRRSIVERVEAEWHKPFDQLMASAVLLDLDLDTLESEAARIVATLEAIGPVNPLAVEEHAEETKRLEFLTAQRDDLISARQSLLQAIREIDGTARTMFLETFVAVQGNFARVFHTLFGGGECELRLANPDDPLESEIDIHAAPRGKRTQRIHLLSSGERTLVAVSLLFSIYLTKPSPFCLMDEVDAPLDDANVGRFTRLLDEFKADTQFLVITHNPRTMQAADAVYGVTMQEPGVSTIVGVRLGEREHV